MGRRIITRPTSIRAGREGTHQKGGDPCATYTSGSSIPQGFGVPWDTLSGTNDMLIKVACDTSSASIDLGTGNALQYIYNTGYLFKTGGTSWNPISYTGANLIAGSWYPGKASTPCL
jgi:hypothetical protein